MTSRSSPELASSVVREGISRSAPAPRRGSQDRSWLLVLGISTIAAVAYCLLASGSIGDPLLDEEMWEFHASRTLLEGGSALQVTGDSNVYHPHGYYWLAAASMELFGVDEVGARMVGVFFTLVTFALVLAMLRRVSGTLRPLEVSLVAGLYLLAPPIVQGSLIITADTAVQHAALTLFFLGCLHWLPLGEPSSPTMGSRDVVRSGSPLAQGMSGLPVKLSGMHGTGGRRARSPSRDGCTTRRALLLAPALALCMALKFTTPCLVVAGIGLYYTVRREPVRGLRLMAVIGGGGLLLFLTAWITYCACIHESPWTLFEYLIMQVEARQGDPLSARALKLARWSLLLITWLGPPSFALMMLAAWRWRATVRAGDPRSARVGFLVVCAVFLLVVHLVVSGIPYAYPRYHFTMLPLWAVILARVGGLALRSTVPVPSLSIAVAAASALWYWGCVGDSFDHVSHGLKLLYLSRQGIDVGMPAWGIAEFALHGALAVAPIALVLWWATRRRRVDWGIALLVPMAIGHGIAIDAIQLRADYATGACYGERGSRALHERLRAGLAPDESVLATKDIVYHAGGRGYEPDWIWGERELILQRLDDPSTRFAVLGMHHNSIEQFRDFLGEGVVADHLRASFDRFRIGSYLVWERRARRVGGRGTPPPPELGGARVVEGG